MITKINCLSNRKFERLGGPLDEIVTVFVHKYIVIMSRPNMTSWRHLIWETGCQDFGRFIFIRNQQKSVLTILAIGSSPLSSADTDVVVICCIYARPAIITRRTGTVILRHH